MMILRIGNVQRLASSVKRLVGKLGLYANRYTLTAKDGLTLIEVLIAVSILGVGTIGVLRAYAGSVSTLEVGQQNIDSVVLAKQILADIEEKGLIEGAETLGSDGGETDHLTWDWSVNSTEIKGFKEVSLTVASKFDSRTLSLKSYVAEKKKEEDE